MTIHISAFLHSDNFLGVHLHLRPRMQKKKNSKYFPHSFIPTNTSICCTPLPHSTSSQQRSSTLNIFFITAWKSPSTSLLFHLCHYQALFPATLQLPLSLSISVSLWSPLQRPSIVFYCFNTMEKATLLISTSNKTQYLLLQNTVLQTFQLHQWIQDQSISDRISTCMRVHYVCVLPGQIVITDQQQVLHQGQEVALSLGVLHSVD